MKLKQIGCTVDLNESALFEHLDFLYNRGLVGEQNLDEDERTYFVTDRGISVLKVIGPLIREAQRIEVRNYEAISNALSEAKVTSRKKIDGSFLILSK